LAPTSATATLNLGFLTVVQEQNSYVGGYLVTNQWGRPLEFRLSTPVQPNRVQQILYAETLQPYICGDLIGKTLLDKTSMTVQIVFTDIEAARELRLRVDIPVVLLAHSQDLQNHPRYPDDKSAIQELLERIQGNFDFAEPFQRIREALTEARKMGVTNRA
jgi:hypothetical protein